MLTLHFKLQGCDIIMTLTSILSYIALLLFVPALPSITHYFGVSREIGQSIIPCFLSGCIVSNILAGVTAAKFTDTDILKLLLCIYVLGGLVSAVSESILILFAGIFLQGVGSGSMLALTQAFLSKTYPHEILTNKISLIGFYTIWVTGLGPVAGAFLIHHLNWRYTFIVLMIYGLILLPLIYILDNSPKAYRNKNLWFSHVLRSYMDNLSNKTYLKFVIPFSFVGAGLHIFYAISPFIIIHELHVSVKIYGTLLIIPIIGLMLGRLISTIESNQDNTKMMFIGCGIACLGAFIMLFNLLPDFFQAVFIISAMGIYTVGLGIISSNARSGVLIVTGGIAAIASTTLAVIFNGISALHTYLISNYLGDFLAESLLIITLLALSVFIWLNWLEKHNQRKLGA